MLHTHFDTFKDKSIAILYNCPVKGFFFCNSSVTRTKTYQDLTVKPLTVNDSVHSSLCRSEGEQDQGSSLQLLNRVASALHDMLMGIICIDLDFLCMY